MRDLFFPKFDQNEKERKTLQPSKSIMTKSRMEQRILYLTELCQRSEGDSKSSLPNTREEIEQTNNPEWAEKEEVAAKKGKSLVKEMSK